MANKSFLERALPYYVLAIATTMYGHSQSNSTPLSGHDIRSRWRIRESWEGETHELELLADEDLFKGAIAVCEEHHLLESLVDDFGPDYYLPTDEAHNGYTSLQVAYAAFFRKHEKAGDGWLSGALEEIARQRAEARKAGHQDNPSVNLATSDEWAPLPLHRESPKLAEVSAAIDRTIEAVRTDNGYSATHPEERRWVLDNLKVFATTIKQETQISLAYVREFAVKPILRLVERFGNSASGMIASAARDTIKDWLKSLGKHVLESIGL